MKFNINRDVLIGPLQQIVSVIEKRQTILILSNVLIFIDNNRIVLTGTDLELQLIVILETECSESGSLTIPARKLFDICRSLPPQAEIKIEQEEDKIKISSGRSRFLLSTLPPEIYPPFVQTEFKNSFFISSAKLKESFDKTIFCMANQDVRFYLVGMSLHISNQKFKLVTSDGHRLAIFEDTLELASGIEAKIVLPRKGVVELSRLLDNLSSNVKVEFSENNIKFSFHNLIFSAKLLDAKYPDYKKIFSKPLLSSIFVNKNSLKEALSRVAILTNEKVKGITFEFSENSLKFNAHNPEHEEAEDEICIDYSGKTFSIAFNVQYVLDAILNIESDMVKLNITEDYSTCFVEEPDAAIYTFVVMSMLL